MMRRSARRGRFGRVAMGVGGMAGFVLATAMTVGAQDLTLPAGTVITGVPGSTVELGRVPIDQDLAGPQCTWEASVTNQESVHPGNDLIVRSGESVLVLSDIESAADKTTTESGSAYLSGEVVVSLRIGPDGIFSGGLDVTIRYDQCTPVTTAPPATAAPTTPAPTTPTTAASTTAAPTTAAPTTPAIEPEPLGPQVEQPTTTTVPATTVTVTKAAAPVLPVTGNRSWRPWVATGSALIGLGAVLTIGARGAATRREAHD